MINQEYPLNFTSNDFAKSFGVELECFSDVLLSKINNLNFNYRFPTNIEYEKLIHETLLKIDTDQQIIGAKERDQVWYNGWDENLKMYINSNFDEESLTPKFIRAGNPVRLNKQFVFPEDQNFELNFIEIYRQWFIENYMNEVENVYEFGCGTGHNLLHVNRVYPNLFLYGSDFVESSVNLINKIGSHKDINIRGDLFNMLEPNYDYVVKKNSAIFTFGALEQLASNLDPILDYFIDQGPNICIHTEPVIELYDDDNLVDYLGKKFQGKRGYSSGLISKLHKLENEGKISILKIKRLFFGSFFMEGYNHIAWKPIK